MPRSWSRSCARSASCRVMPAARIAATSEPDRRRTLLPPIGKRSPGPYRTSVFSRVVRRYAMPSRPPSAASAPPRSWRRTGRGQCCRRRRASSRGPRAPSGKGRPRRSGARPRASPRGTAAPAETAAIRIWSYAREEGGERRRERDEPEHLHADRRGDELLLGDVHLEEPMRVRLREPLRVPVEGFDLPVERDDVPARGARRRRPRTPRASRPSPRRRSAGPRTPRDAARGAASSGAGPAGPRRDRRLGCRAPRAPAPPRPSRAPCRASPPCPRGTTRPRPSSCARRCTSGDRTVPPARTRGRCRRAGGRR